MANPNKPSSKETLKSELASLLATTHGEIQEAAQSIADALDKLIQTEGAENKAKFEAVLLQAMSIPKSSHFSAADPKVKQAIMDILALAQEVLDSGLNDLIAANQKIKDEKKKLKQRIHEIEQKTGRRPSH